MITKFQKQSGRALGIASIILAVALIGLLGFIFWKNLVGQNHIDSNQANVADNTIAANDTSVAKPVEVQYKKYVSSTGSGLSFKYPATWLFEPPTEAFKNLNGGEMTSYDLTSEAYKLDPSTTSAPVTINQYFCLNIIEYKGEWSYSNNVNSGNEIRSEAFEVGGTTYYLKTYKDSSLNRNNKPMGNIMRLVASSQAGMLPSNYIKANNGYVIEAVAQFNCVQGGEGIKNLDDDFYAQPEVIEAIKTIKSLSINNT